MSVGKAFLQFLKLFLIVGVVGELFYLLSNILKFQEITVPIFLIIGTLFSYWIFFKFILKKKFDLEVKGIFKPIQENLIFAIILIAIGIKLFQKPLFDLYNYFIIPRGLLSSNFLIPQNSELDFKFIIYLISGLLIAPIFEEIIFRKYLLGSLVKQNSVLKSILISAICFSLYHIPNFGNLLPSFLFGVITGYIYFKTRNLTYTILLHFCINLLVGVQKLSGRTINENLFHLHFNIYYWLITTIGGTIVIYFGIKLFNKNLEKTKIEV